MATFTYTVDSSGNIYQPSSINALVNDYIVVDNKDTSKPYTGGNIYVMRFVNDETDNKCNQLVGNETNSLEIGKCYQIAGSAKSHTFQITTTAPTNSNGNGGPKQETDNGSLHVGSGGHDDGDDDDDGDGDGGGRRP